MLPACLRHRGHGGSQRQQARAGVVRGTQGRRNRPIRQGLRGLFASLRPDHAQRVLGHANQGQHAVSRQKAAPEKAGRQDTARRSDRADR